MTLAASSSPWSRCCVDEKAIPGMRRTGQGLPLGHPSRTSGMLWSSSREGQRQVPPPFVKDFVKGGLGGISRRPWDSLGLRMLGGIHLDDYLSPSSVEVHDVVADRLLSVKLDCLDLLAAQPFPARTFIKSPLAPLFQRGGQSGLPSPTLKEGGKERAPQPYFRRGGKERAPQPYFQRGGDRAGSPALLSKRGERAGSLALLSKRGERAGSPALLSKRGERAGSLALLSKRGDRAGSLALFSRAPRFTGWSRKTPRCAPPCRRGPPSFGACGARRGRALARTGPDGRSGH